jgi:hypothetical protein
VLSNEEGLGNLTIPFADARGFVVAFMFTVDILIVFMYMIGFTIIPAYADDIAITLANTRGFIVDITHTQPPSLHTGTHGGIITAYSDMPSN